MKEFGELARAGAYWESRGFVPWQQDGMAGVYRRMTVRKASMLGEVARYYADDYILWRHNGKSDQETVFRSWRALPDVMVQRVVFLTREPGAGRRARAFLLGFRGYLEIYAYGAGNRAHRGMKDLAGLIDEALLVIEKIGDTQQTMA